MSASAWNINNLDYKINDRILGIFNLLVTLHVLLAAESFSTNIAVVKGRCVAPLGEKDGYFQIQHLTFWRTRNYLNKKSCIITS